MALCYEGDARASELELCALEDACGEITSAENTCAFKENDGGSVPLKIVKPTTGLKSTCSSSPRHVNHLLWRPPYRVHHWGSSDPLPVVNMPDNLPDKSLETCLKYLGTSLEARFINSGTSTPSVKSSASATWSEK